MSQAVGSSRNALPPHAPYEGERRFRVEDRFRILVDAVTDYAVFMLDPHGVVSTWNAGAERIKGYRADEIVGCPVSVFYQPEAIANCLPERMLVLAATEGKHSEEGWRVRKDGSRLWANIVTTALRATDGTLLGFGVVTRDLTEPRRAEQALHAAYTQLHSALECMSDCVMTLGRDWTILYGNRRTMDLLPDFQVGRSYWECFPMVLGSPTEALLRNAMENRVAASYEKLFKIHDIWFKIRLFPSEVGLSIFFTNITEEKKLQQRVELEQELREKRIEALSHMAGGLAHEISNPLAIIHARASDLAASVEVGEVASPQEITKACQSIVDTADRAMRILRGLRGFARESGTDPMEWASIPQIVDQCLEFHQARFTRQNIDLLVHLSPEFPLVLCRESQIEQILTNLLNNAFDAIEQSGATERWVRLTTSLEAGRVVIDVTDSGPGIDDKFRPYLMEPFFTTKTSGLGMGVGLSLSRAIAQEHGGSLTLCPQGRLTCFRLILPVNPTATPGIV